MLPDGTCIKILWTFFLCRCIEVFAMVVPARLCLWKKMSVNPWSKLFLSSHRILLVKVWIVCALEHRLMCKKFKTTEHAFIDCWGAVFYWDVLQCMLQQDFPITDAYGIILSHWSCQIPIQPHLLLGLKSIWWPFTDVRNSYPRVRYDKGYFAESTGRIKMS